MWFDNGTIYWWSEDSNPFLADDLSDMFYNLSNITTINLSNLDFRYVTKMDYMFNGCSKLKNITYGNFNTSKVTSMIGMFHSTYSLTTLNLSSFNTSKDQKLTLL